MSKLVKVDRNTFNTISAIRSSGVTNMFDTSVVINLARALGDSKTADWIRDNKNEYAKGIFNGFEVVKEAS